MFSNIVSGVKNTLFTPLCTILLPGAATDTTGNRRHSELDPRLELAVPLDGGLNQEDREQQAKEELLRGRASPREGRRVWCSV